MKAVDTIERAESLSELWTGTLISDILDTQVERVKTAVMNEEEIVDALVVDLSQMCDFAEKETDE